VPALVAIEVGDRSDDLISFCADLAKNPECVRLAIVGHLDDESISGIISGCNDRIRISHLREFKMEEILSDRAIDRFAFLPHDESYSSPPLSTLPPFGTVLVPWMPRCRLPTSGVFESVRAVRAWATNRETIESIPNLTAFPDLPAAFRFLSKNGNLTFRTSKTGIEYRPGRLAVPLKTYISRNSRILVVIPHWRSEQYLERCLQSISRQTRVPDAICVIDDCSERIPRDVVSGFRGVSLYRAQQNVGPYELVQAVVNRTDFDAICFLDSDDWCAEDRLEHQLCMAELHCADLLGSQEVRFDESTGQFSAAHYPANVNAALQLRASYSLLHPSSIISRHLIVRLGGFSGMRFSGDLELLHRAVFAGRVINTDGFSYFRRVRRDSLTSASETGLHTDARRAIETEVVKRWKLNIERSKSGETCDLTPLWPCKGVQLDHLIGPKLGTRNKAFGSAPVNQIETELDPYGRYLAKPSDNPGVRTHLESELARLLGTYNSLSTPVDIVKRFDDDRRPEGALVREVASLSWLQAAWRQGLLVSETEIKHQYQKRKNTNEEFPKVTANIVTNNTSQNSQQVLRCLVSIMQNLSQFGRTTSIFVFDDSRPGDESPELAGSVRDLSQRYGQQVHFVDLNTKSRLAKELARITGIDPLVIEFALLGDRRFGNTVGANRNCVLLANLGHCAVSFDDDVVPGRPLSFRESTQGAITSSNTNEFWFTGFDHLLRDAGVDLIGMHQDILGRPLIAPLVAKGDPLVCENLSRRMRKLLCSGNGTICLSFNGALGDCALPNPAALPLLSGNSRQRLTYSPTAYAEAMKSRILLRSSRMLTVSDTVSASFGLAMGICVDRPVPPFLPVLTGEDFLFSHMMLGINTDAAFVHLPSVVQHNPTRPRFYSTDLTAAGEETHASTVLSTLFSLTLASVVEPDPWARIRKWGALLQDLCHLEAAEFVSYIDGVIRSGKRQYIERTYALIQNHRGSPTYWASDLLDQLQLIERRLDQPEHLLPTDILSSTGLDFRGLVESFASLLLCWPEMLKAVRQMHFGWNEVTQCSN
jgi:hypothetical protein